MLGQQLNCCLNIEILFITKTRKDEITKKIEGVDFVFSLFRAFVLKMDVVVLSYFVELQQSAKK